MQRIFWTFVCLFLCAATVWAQPEGRRGVGVVPKAHRYALLVGVNTYPRQFQSLQYCEADMEALEEALLAIGFQPENIVRLSTSSDDPSLLPTRSNILKQARLLADQADQGSMFVLALSGHGASLNGESYFCPMDAVYKDLSSLVKRSDLYQIVEDCEAKQKLVFVDACRESLVDSGWKTIGGMGPLVDPVGIENPGFFIISSCKTGQFSWEDAELKHGVFTYFLVEGLKGKAAQNGQISVHNLFSYVNYETKKYIRLTRQESQIPLLRGDEEELDDFILAKLESDSSSVPPTVSGPVTPPEPPKPAVRKAGERMVKTVNGIEYAFRWCPAGEFLMGSPEDEPGRYDDETQHSVTLTQGFWMLETEVTQAMWKSVMGTDPSHFKGSQNPVERVSWKECDDFCKKLSSQLGLTVSLPTEAQWEYACRAGTTSAYSFGSSLNGREANCDGNYPYGTSTKGPYLEKTVPVKSYAPNAWGLYDMHGNVWEWCQDWYDSDYYAASPTSDPTGPNSGSIRVNRGGSWVNFAQYCRSAARAGRMPDLRDYSLGFRIVLAAPAASISEPVPPPGPTEESTPETTQLSESSGSFHTAGERMVKTVDGIEYAFRWCPAGTFTMGSPSSEPDRGDDETQHRVTLTRGFWMLETEVTQAMWESVMGTSISQQRDKADTSWPLDGEGSDYPMYYVNWEECRSFCKKLSDKLGLMVSLPTEAQWEYACRAGTTGAYAGNLDEMGWYDSNSGSKTHPVGEKKPNAWGLYDMHGNVWEWCQDWYGSYSTSPTSDPCNEDSGSDRVNRGGGWIYDVRDCRSADRNWFTPDFRVDYLGFRPVLASPVPEE